MNNANTALKAVRIARGHTQLSLARAIGTSEGQISCLETGRRRASASIRQRIAAALAVDERKIFAEADHA
ncbi:MAG: helix-turn-helix transcriptional regulator [Verrucomicrobia bacterium]|nr:helix-turn-helix transcriptional regulator [Verrucomicrobiota bacterium]